MKQKTHSGTKKRVKITGSGKVLFRKSCKNHLLSSKNKRAIKAYKGGVEAPKGHLKVIARLLHLDR